MRGQLILLTALVLSLAVAVILIAQVSISMGQFSGQSRTGYGIYAKAWPEAVDLADSHTLQAATKGASQITVGAMTAGLYANPPYASRWLTYNLTYYYLNKSLAAVKASFLPLGAQLQFNSIVWYYGFNGSLGPYPIATTLAKYNLEPVRRGFLAVPGAKTYKITVVWYANDYTGYYIATYGSHVSEPGAPGESYNVAVADLLQEFSKSDLKRRLFVFLVYYDPDNRRCRLWQLPWWSEIKKCPLCLIHVRIPDINEIGMADPILQQGKAAELLMILLPRVLEGDKIPALLSGYCTQDGGIQSLEVEVNPDVNDNPKAVFSTYVAYNGSKPLSYSRPWYWDANDIASWQSSVVNTKSCDYNVPEKGVMSSYITTVYDSGFGAVAEISATYHGGAKNWGFNVNSPEISIPQTWPGFTVESLVKPMSANTIRPARLDLYYYTSSPSSNHPMCANYYGLQAVSPVLVWANWLGYSPGGGQDRGVWNGRTWDDAGSVPFRAQWYLFSISVSQSVVLYQVYSYNATRPTKVLGTKQYANNWLGTSWRFYVVLGSAIVDNPASDSPWTEAARYAYVRIRPWVNPPPSVMINDVWSVPMVRPSRVDIIAADRAYGKSLINMVGSIGLANIQELWIRRSVSLNASAVQCAPPTVQPNQITYCYDITVNSSIPRGSLSARFTLFYSIGSTYVNATCGSSALCSVQLLEYRGYFQNVDTAVWRAVFTVPTWASHSIIVNVYGTRVAISLNTPKLYVISAGGNSYYVINEGSGTAVFIFPWQGNAPLLASYSPDDAKYIGVYHVTDGSRRWTVVLVPPGSVVKLSFTASITLDRQYLVPWQARIPNVIQPVSQPCSSPSYVRVYIPGNITLLRYYLLIPYRFTSAQRVYGFIGGSWQPTSSYLDPSSMDPPSMLWVKIDTSSLGVPLSNRALLLALCGDTNNPDPRAFFGKYGSSRYQRNSYYQSQISLSIYPDGFTVVIWPSQSYMTVALSNNTNGWQQLEGECTETIREVGILYYRRLRDRELWWHYDGFCYDRHIWERPGSGTPLIYMISVTKAMVLYQVATGIDTSTWWLRSYPNVAKAFSARPITSFRYVSASAQFNVAVIPFTWPRPYLYIDFSTNPGPYWTT